METLSERAIRWVCPYSLRQTTKSEENEIKRLIAFGAEVEQSIAAELARVKEELSKAIDKNMACLATLDALRADRDDWRDNYLQMVNSLLAGSRRMKALEEFATRMRELEDALGSDLHPSVERGLVALDAAVKQVAHVLDENGSPIAEGPEAELARLREKYDLLVAHYARYIERLGYYYRAGDDRGDLRSLVGDAEDGPLPDAMVKFWRVVKASRPFLHGHTMEDTERYRAELADALIQWDTK